MAVKRHNHSRGDRAPHQAIILVAVRPPAQERNEGADPFKNLVTVSFARLQPFWLLRWRLWPVLAVSGPSHRTEPSTLLGNGLESRRKLLRHVLDKGA